MMASKASRTTIPGINAEHAIVTPDSLALSGEHAIEEALSRIANRYAQLSGYAQNANARYHIVLTVESSSDADSE